jgi:TPR repeat protein
MKYWVLLLGMSIGIAFARPIGAQTLYPITSQSANYSLKTQLSPAQIETFNRIFQFGKFDPNRAIALRVKLQPLAEANDPVACYWLAKTYDWYEFGVGKVADRPIALKWYVQSAKLNYFPAAYFLYQTYFYGNMGVAIDYPEAIKWLNRSLELSSPANKSDILTEFARMSDPDRDDNPIALRKIISRNRTAHLGYLKQAFDLEPQNPRLADYYGDSLYKAKQYTVALSVLKISDNPYTWRQIGRMYENGEGTKSDLTQALFWYKKMAIEGKKLENDLNPLSLYGKHEVYRLICLKKVTPQQAKPVYTPADYYKVFGRWADAKCVYSPG